MNSPSTTQAQSYSPYPTASADQFFEAFKLEFNFTEDTRGLDRSGHGETTPHPFQLLADWNSPRIFVTLIDVKEPDRWLHKAYKAAGKDSLVVCLVPHKHETAWWYLYSRLATEVRLLHGRLTDDEHRNGSSHKVALLIFRPRS